LKAKLYILFFTILCFNSIFSQENAHTGIDISLRNSIKLNRFLINPAFSYAREKAPSITVSNKHQSVAFENAPVLYFANYQGKIANETRFAIGIYNQSIGVLTNTGGIINFSHNLPFDDYSNLTFGLNTYIYSSKFDLSRSITESPEPLLFNQDKSNIISFRPGLNYNFGGFDVGVVATNYIAYNLTTSQSAKDIVGRGFLGYAMYTKELYSYYNILDGANFSSMIQVENTSETTGFSGMLLLDQPDLGWVQGGYNSLYGINAGVGFNITEKFEIGYSFNMGIANTALFGSSHEFSLSYSFIDYEETYNHWKQAKKVNKKKPVSTKTKTAPAKPKPVVKKAEPVKEDLAQVEADRLAKEKAEADRLAREKAEADRLAREKAEADRLAKEKADADRLAREKADADRLAREKAEADRLAKEKADADRLAREKADADRLAREKAEADRLAKEKAEADRLAREKAETDRLAKEKAEADRLAKEKADADRLAREKAEADRLAKEKADADRLAKESASMKVEDKIAKMEADLNVSNSLLDTYKNEIAKKTKNSDAQIKKLEDIVKEQDLDLKAYLSEGDPNADTQTRKFVSTTQVNAQIAEVKAEISENKKVFNDLIIEIEASNKDRINELKAQGIDAESLKMLNKYYQDVIDNLKVKRQEYINLERIADEKMIQIKEEKEAERLRRIKKAEYDSEQQRILNDQMSLENIKNSSNKAQNQGTVLNQTDNDTEDVSGDTNNIPIIGKLNGVASGYYLVLDTFKDTKERDAYIAQVVVSGGSNVKLFYNIHNTTYYVYINHFDSLTDAMNALEAKGTTSYNKNMFIVKVE
jgi:type IX secretion system PorP/SprF family membrane protein